MGAEKIVEKILQDARDKAQEITSGAQAEAGKIVAEANKAAEGKKTVSLAAGDKEAALTKQRIVASAHMEAKKLLLQTKQDLLSAAFDSALEKIKNMDNTQFERLMTNLMIHLVETATRSPSSARRIKSGLARSFYIM